MNEQLPMVRRTPRIGVNGLLLDEFEVISLRLAVEAVILLHEDDNTTKLLEMLLELRRRGSPLIADLREIIRLFNDPRHYEREVK